jgi:NCAIR mutase (PurE)-related protein
VYDVGVAGLHRLTAQLDRLRQASALIVVAGMEAP